MVGDDEQNVWGVLRSDDASGNDALCHVTRNDKMIIGGVVD